MTTSVNPMLLLKIQERFFHFLPSILSICTIMLVAWTFSHFMKDYLTHKHRRTMENKNVTDKEVYADLCANGTLKWMNLFTVIIPTLGIYSPAHTTFLYTAPLLLIYDAPTTEFWFIAYATYFLRGLMNLIRLSESKKLETEFLMVPKQYRPRIFFVMKSVIILFFTCTSAVCGYFTVSHQSLWIGLIAHIIEAFAATFIFLPIGSIIFVFAIMGIFGTEEQVEKNEAPELE